MDRSPDARRSYQSEHAGSPSTRHADCNDLRLNFANECTRVKLFYSLNSDLYFAFHTAPTLNHEPIFVPHVPPQTSRPRVAAPSRTSPRPRCVEGLTVHRSASPIPVPLSHAAISAYLTSTQRRRHRPLPLLAPNTPNTPIPQYPQRPPSSSLAALPPTALTAAKCFI